MSVVSVVRQCVFQNAIRSEEHTGQPLTSLTPLTETRGSNNPNWVYGLWPISHN